MPAKTDHTHLRLVSVPTSSGPLLLPYHVRRSKRARFIRVSLDVRNHALLTLPQRASLREGMDFLRSQGDWLDRSLRSAPRPFTLSEWLERKPRLSAFGKSLRLRFAHSDHRPDFRLYEESRTVAFLVANDETYDENVLKVCRQFAKEVLTARTLQLAIQHRLHPRRITVRNQRTRWGSCSGNKTISLNWRLVLLSPRLQDYVILHELAHLREMNHSDAFWAALRELDPRARQNDRALTLQQTPLMALGR
ncbi:MAG: M48 family metallopeptidase [Opitutales bacterium]